MRYSVPTLFEHTYCILIKFLLFDKRVPVVPIVSVMVAARLDDPVFKSFLNQDQH
jgi:hypothetical protein